MAFKKNFNKLLIILLLLFYLIPINIFAYPSKVLLGGDTIGINIKSQGIVVVGFYKINGISPGALASLQIGDIITKVEDTPINSLNDLTENDNLNHDILITYLRDNKENTTTLSPVSEDGIYKTGLYIKDSISGIGTLTFIDKASNTFGALGHEIRESNSQLRFVIKEGNIFNTNITSITKSEVNIPGSKNASFEKVIGTVDKNTPSGIFGTFTGLYDNEEIEVSNEIEKGSAYLRTNITDDLIENYEIEIIRVNNNDSSKNILFEVTDQRLLDKTGGIIQGMSGSPIIQNNKLVGAVNYVVVDHPNKGYGILIENMLKEIS